MSLIWQRILPLLFNPVQYRYTGSEITVTETAVFDALCKFCVPRPRRKWIEKAMKGFVLVGIASNDEKDSYTIRYVMESRPQDVFARLWEARSQAR